MHKKLILALLFLPVTLLGQAVRYNSNVYTINASAPQPGALYPVLASSSAKVSICNAPATGFTVLNAATNTISNGCTNFATTFTNAAESGTCAAPNQLTRTSSTACVGNVDAEGGFGVWIASGTYQYTVTLSYGSFGPYDFSVGGSGGGGGGNVLPAPQAQLAGYPSVGTTAIVGASYASGSPSPLLNFVTPLLQGQANCDQFTTGGGNNCVANALAAGETNIIVPPYYTGTDYPLGNASMPNATMTADYRGGDFIRTHTNYFSSNPGYTAAEYTSCAIGPAFSRSVDCTDIADVDATTGTYTAGLWNSHKSFGIVTTKPAQEINQSMDIQQFCLAAGDCGGLYMYTTNQARAAAGGDESNLAVSIEQQSPFVTAGTIAAGGGGAGAELVQTSGILSAGAGRDLVSTSELQASGNITGYTTPGGIAPNTITTSDTHTASTAIGTLNGACGANVNPSSPATTTCAVTMSLGTFSGTPIGGQSTAKVCFSDNRHYEEADVVGTPTSVSLTVKLSFTHQSGITIFQGSCGGALVLGYGWTNPFTAFLNQVTTYAITGAPTTTSFAYVILFNEGQNGNVPITPPPTYSSTLSTVTRSGTAISAISNGAIAVNYNNLTIPNGAQICITGNSNSAMNVCNITSTTTSGQGFVVNGTSAGAAGSGTGGTIALSGVNNYFVYCMATVTKVNGVTQSVQDGNGQFGLTPNTCTWANNAPVVLANAYNQGFSDLRLLSVATVPPEAGVVGSNILANFSMVGAAWSNGVGICWNCEQNDPTTNYEGYGGNYQGHLMNLSDAMMHGYFDINAPIPSGTSADGSVAGFFAKFEEPPAGGSGVSTFDVFQFFGASTSSALTVDFNASLLSYSGTTFANNANANNMSAFTFSNNLGLVLTFDPTLGQNWQCIQFNTALPVTNRACAPLTTTGFEADQTGVDTFLHFKQANHAGGFKFDIVNAGGSAIDTPIQINESGITQVGITDGCATWASGILSSTGVACGSGGGGSGTVTTFSAGTLSPLFTTSVANPTSTPALTFSLTNAAQNSVFAGPPSGGPGAPSYQTAPTISAANMTSFPTFNQNTTGTASNLSGTPALPNGTTATTQTLGDNTTKLATDAFVIANAGTVTHTGALTALHCVIGNGTADEKVDTGCTTDGAGNVSVASLTATGAPSISTGTASNTDLTGILTASGGTATYTFAGTYTSAPVCVVQDDTTIASLLTKTVSTTTLTATTTGATDHVSYVCIGRN